ATSVYYAAHAGDHAIYPDCTEEFVKSLDTTVFIGNKWNEIEVRSPFVRIDKTELVQLGMHNTAPLELTWSCYEGKDRPCLKCGTCIERTEAFLLNDEVDPALSDEEWKEATRLYSMYKAQE
ncbi:MAG: 7-cyano-7-deazaguanine synthase, partial [Gammaproteobacteria bacterium]|nr:7-cyano-7-deazaguanine synthase [Gammaproteobacteria bacterium]